MSEFRLDQDRESEIPSHGNGLTAPGAQAEARVASAEPVADVKPPPARQGRIAGWLSRLRGSPPTEASERARTYLTRSTETESDTATSRLLVSNTPDADLTLASALPEPGGTPEPEPALVPDWLREAEPAESAANAVMGDTSIDLPTTLREQNLPASELDELPDWLEPAPTARPGSADVRSEAEHALDLKDAEEAVPAAPPSDTSSETADPVASAPVLDPTTNAQPETPDFFSEGVLPSFDELEKSSPAQEVEAQPASESSELPDWIRELPPEPETNPLEGVQLGELPDWLSEVTPTSAETELVNRTAPLASDETRSDESPRDTLPDWLREAIAPEAEAQVSTGEPLTYLYGPGAVLEPEPLGELVEESGPLAGLSGVLPIAPALTQPKASVAPLPPTIDGARVFESVLARAATLEATTPPAESAPRRQIVPNGVIYLLVVLAALVPFFLPSNLSGLGLSVTDPTTTGFFDQLQAIAPGSTVLLSFDYTPGQALELNPAARVVVQDLARRHVNVLAVSTSPAGAQLAQTILNETSRTDPGWQRGTNFVNVGFVPGNEAGLRALADRWFPANQSDFDQIPLASSPLATQVKGLSDVALVIEIAGTDESLRWWMEQVQPRRATAFAAIVSAAVEPQARNYRNSNQLTSFLRGLSGAAEYELSLNHPGATVRTVDAQSFAHLVLAGIIVLGNLAFLIGKLMKKQNLT